jgi:hypothetical protein
MVRTPPSLSFLFLLLLFYNIGLLGRAARRSVPGLAADEACALETPFRALFAAFPGDRAPSRCSSFALFLGGPLSLSLTLRLFSSHNRRAISAEMAQSSGPVVLGVRAYLRDVLVVPGLLPDLAMPIILSLASS